MNQPWPTSMLDALEALDGQEKPHGLYGIRQAHSQKGRLPTLAHLLSSFGKASKFRPAGVRGIRNRFGSDAIGFCTEAGECVALQVLDYATTKVRHYGSVYRLD